MRGPAGGARSSVAAVVLTMLALLCLARRGQAFALGSSSSMFAAGSRPAASARPVTAWRRPRVLHMSASSVDATAVTELKSKIAAAGDQIRR
jgi:hypothetical protein